MLRHTPPIPRLAAVLLTLALAGCAVTTLHESSGEYLDDTVITARVKASLLTHREVSAAQINVETFKGRVQLSGFVKSKLQRFQAEAIARSVRGVSEVINDIQLR